MSKKIKITDLKQDDKNFNKHTADGIALLEKSVETVGVIESITVSADDKIISGNARQKVMSEKFNGVEPIYVETDGTRPVILKRTDIKGDTKEFFEAALLANTVAKKNINLDLEVIQEVAVEEYGIDVEELGVQIYHDGDAFDYDANSSEEEIDLSKFNQRADSYLNNSVRQIVLIFENDLHKQVIERLEAVGADFGISDDNSSIVLKLLEFYEQHEK